MQWQWAAAVYTNTFSNNNNAIGVKPVDDTKASQYKNSDHAGTPENYKQYVTGGATGGGGSNWTGGYSGTAGVAPYIDPADVSPSVLDFGIVTFSPTPMTSGPMTATLTNNQGTNLSISTVTLGGSYPSDFTVTNNGCSGKSLVPGANCTVTLTFTPGASGTRAATLWFADGAATSPQKVTLTGAGN